MAKLPFTFTTLSRAGAEGKFKSGLAGTGEIETRYHTATHLLNAALKVVLEDENIHQMGSNITEERMRFDFNFDRKLTDEEKTKIDKYYAELNKTEYQTAYITAEYQIDEQY